MTKPFSMEELVLRSRPFCGVLRLPEAGEEVTEFTVGLYSYDYTTQSLTLNGESQRLTTKENELLFMLCKHKNACSSGRTHCGTFGATPTTSTDAAWTFTSPNFGST